MKYVFPRITVLFAALLLFSAVLSAQVKEITGAEYEAAINAADKTSSSTFPRIVTSSFNGTDSYKSWTRTRYESTDKRYEEIKETSSKGVSFTRRVHIANETFEREENGVWVRQNIRTMYGATGEQAPSVVVFTSETIRASSDVFVQLTKTEMWESGRERIFKHKLDANGRIVRSEVNDNWSNSTDYEYPAKITPIKKPKLGSKEDI